MSTRKKKIELPIHHSRGKMSKRFKDIKPPTLEEQIEFNLGEVINPEAFEESFVKIIAKGRTAKKIKTALTRKKPKVEYIKSLDEIDWEENGGR